MVPTPRAVNHSGCSETHGWSGEACRSREDVAYIGDSCVDMETGKNAGVTTIGASWGFRPRTELEAYNPDFIADEACDILRFLGISEK